MEKIEMFKNSKIKNNLLCSYHGKNSLALEKAIHCSCAICSGRMVLVCRNLDHALIYI